MPFSISSFGLGLLSASVLAAPHTISVTISGTVNTHHVADNHYTLNIAGQTYEGPLDAPNKASWKNISTFTRPVQGNGPFHVAIQASDYGVIAGVWATVRVDGQLIDSTGTKGSLFFISDAPSDRNWWNSTTYNSKGWKVQEQSSCPPALASLWNNHTAEFQRVSGSNATPVWTPDCAKVGNKSSLKFNYLRLDMDNLGI